MIRESIRHLLIDDADVAYMIGQRVYPMVVPQKTKDTGSLMPCVVYQVQGEERQKTYCATGKLIRCTISLDCYAVRVMDATELAARVRRRLLDFRGEVGSTGAELVIRDVSLIRVLDLFDMEPGLFRVSQLYDVWYEEEE